MKTELTAEELLQYFAEAVQDHDIIAADNLKAKLRARLAAGDRALEALKIFADPDNWNLYAGIYEWDHGEVSKGQWVFSNPTEIARAALGLQEPQP